jgi:uncharacterized membrane protein (DUF106 family)
MENKKGFSMVWFMVVLGISIYIASLWDKRLFGQDMFLKTNIGKILDPSLGALMNWNLYIGFLVIVGVTSLVLTISQKYLSDQKQLKELRKEQKYLQAEMKKYREHPEKLLELQKKQFEFFPKTFELTMKPVLYTSIPIILLFRWFSDYLLPIFGSWWILWYLIGSMVFSTIFRKWLDVA